MEEARDTLWSVERLEGALAMAAQGGARGRVRISAPAASVRSGLVPLLPVFLDVLPEIRVDLRGTDASDDLALQGVDIAIRTGPVDGSPAHVSLHLLDFPRLACAIPHFRSATGRPMVRTTSAETR